MKQKQKGFTLIELLVVIAIIGLLSTLAVVSLSAARSRARDAKRLADLRNVQSALELYASDKGVYPVYTTLTPPISVNTVDGSCLDGAAMTTTAWKTTCGTGTSPLIVLKADVVSATDYAFQYRSNTDGTKYVLWVTMENKGGACALPEGITELATGKVLSDCNTLAGF